MKNTDTWSWYTLAFVQLYILYYTEVNLALYMCIDDPYNDNTE